MIRRKQYDTSAKYGATPARYINGEPVAKSPYKSDADVTKILCVGAHGKTLADRLAQNPFFEVLHAQNPNPEVMKFVDVLLYDSEDGIPQPLLSRFGRVLSRGFSLGDIESPESYGKLARGVRREALGMERAQNGI
ncbi:MAG: hypothetical protein ABIH37_04695 [archaeon]